LVGVQSIGSGKRTVKNTRGGGESTGKRGSWGKRGGRAVGPKRVMDIVAFKKKNATETWAQKGTNCSDTGGGEKPTSVTPDQLGHWEISEKKTTTKTEITQRRDKVTFNSSSFRIRSPRREKTGRNHFESSLGGWWVFGWVVLGVGREGGFFWGGGGVVVVGVFCGVLGGGWGWGWFLGLFLGWGFWGGFGGRFGGFWGGCGYVCGGLL